MMRRRGWKVIASIAVMVLVGAACSKKAANNQGQSPSTGPIVIGASLPLTGEFAEPGKAVQNAYQIWQDMVNSSGGLLGRQVQFKIYDDASDQNTAVSDYNRLISQDKVDLLLGTFSSLLNLPASAVAERNRMLFVEPAGGSPDMFTRGFKYLFFSQLAVAAKQGDLFVQWLMSLPAGQRPKTAAYPTQDDPFARPVVEGIQAKLEAAGIKTVYSQVYPPDTTNFDTIANAIKASGADIVAQGSIFDDAVGLIRSFIKVGYTPKAIFQTTAPSLGTQYSKGIGAGNTEGVFYASSWSQQATYPMNQDFVNAYKAKFGEDPSEEAANGFAAAQVLQAAATAVGSLDQTKMADWLHANTVTTISGPIAWDQTGAPTGSYLLAQWQSGKQEIVAPPDVATSQTIVYPKPNWQ